MNTNNIIAIVAVFAIAIAFVNLSVTLMKTDEFKKLTGFGVLRGSVNITIISFRDVNFTRPEMNFSYGSLDAGVNNATLYTTGAGNVVVARGNWSASAASAKGLILENIGSGNASVTLQAAKSAATLWGGTATERAYMWNISSKEVGSCSTDAASELLNVFRDVNSSASGKFCNHLSSLSASNEIYIDILLSIPYDTTAGQTVGDTITATAGSPS